MGIARPGHEMKNTKRTIDMIPADDRSEALTAREREVAVLVMRGFSNKQVARELGLSTGTVKLHLHRVFQKLGAKSRYALRVQIEF